MLSTGRAHIPVARVPAIGYSLPMRILQIGKYYPPARGGMETVLRHTCEGLLDRGHEVVAVVAAEGNVGAESILNGPATGRPGRLVRCARVAVWNSQPVTPGLTSRLRRELRVFRPDIVQLHLPNPLASLATLMALPQGKDGPRLAVWYHSDIVRQRLGGLLLGPMTRAVLQRSRGIAVSTGSLRDQSRQLRALRDRVTVIPFGIDPDAWPATPRPADGPLLFVGRLVYYKGVELLLDTVARLPQARLVVVGDGPLRDRLQARARRDDLAGRVRFAGELDDADLHAEMARAAALVLPSLERSETFGLVQLEAMAAGLPVISTQLPTGVAEVNVDGETGRLVPPGDVGALARALDEVLADPERSAAWGRNGRTRVCARFERDAMVGALEHWFADLMAGDDR